MFYKHYQQISSNKKIVTDLWRDRAEGTKALLHSTVHPYARLLNMQMLKRV